MSPFNVWLFDSRFWNGILPPQGDKYQGYIAKATSGDWVSPDFPGQYRAAGQLFGERRSAWAFFLYVDDPVVSARVYHKAMLDNGGYGRIPPVLDLEDTRAPATLAAVDRMWIMLQEMEQLSGREVLCYTADWIWRRWAPYVQSRHGFYLRNLWEADPPPDTPEPGKWTKDKLVMIQVRLDFNPGGFKEDIDESLARQDWWEGLMAGQPPFPHATIEERVIRLEAQAHSHG